MTFLRRPIHAIGLLDAAGIAAVIVVTLWSMHWSLLIRSTLVTGGDMGAHLALPAFLQSQGDWWNLTPWFPGWFAGMPAYTYYFPLPDYVALILSYVVGFAVAFKWATLLGSVSLPIAAYLMGRLFRAPRPVPLALAMATLPFLFDANFTIDGGNLFSTMAGEYAFSLALSLSLVVLGLVARGVVTSRGYWWTGALLSLTLAAHVLPWMFALVMMVIIALVAYVEPSSPDGNVIVGDRVRPWRFVCGAGALSLVLSAWWLVPFATSQQFTNSMGYSNQPTSSLHAIFSWLGWFTTNGGASGDRWVLVLAGIGLAVAAWTRNRLGIILSLWCVASFVAYASDPQSVIWNERLIPFWYLGTHLLAGWCVGYAALRWAYRRSARVSQVMQPLPQHLETPADVTWRRTWLAREHRRRMLNAGSVVILLGLLSTVPGVVPSWASALHLTTSGNQVASWAEWNYSGYQGKPAWREYHDIMTTMGDVAAKYGCGRAMWEYNASENRFGTPMALMLLPYWTHNCVDSMEGLFFESSATTPYHFLDQAELSAAPSDAQVGLPYGNLNVSLGVRHLQLLGVKYFMAFSPGVIAEANEDPALRLVATTKKWPSPGAQWRIYLVKNSSLVRPLTHVPVVNGTLTSRITWQQANVTWWLDPSSWSVPWAAAGPTSWPRGGTLSLSHAVLPSNVVSDITTTTQSISFHVRRVGVPVEVAISYFPRWRTSGARGPWRVSPNFMVVVPTSHQVTLRYATTPEMTVSGAVSDAGWGILAMGTLWTLRRRRSRR